MLDANLCRKFLGKHYYKNCHRILRQEGILKFEHASSNLHYHGRIDIKNWSFEEYKSSIEHFWYKLVPDGEVVVEKECNATGLAIYMSKEEYEYSLKTGGGNEIFLPYPVRK